MNKCARVLITGGGGFIGRCLVANLIGIDGYRVTIGTRRGHNETPPPDAKIFEISGIDGETNWRDALIDTNVVIHAAARVHVMNDNVQNPDWEFRKVNELGTLNLARQAARMGVRRFIFISSIKVNGEATIGGTPFTADGALSPVDAYGLSKLEAERGLLALSEESGMEVVIIRPVLVYGPGVKANFLRLMTCVNRGIPLPFGAIHNKRSLVALDNLVDLILRCIDHPAAANEVFLVSDGEDLSTSELLRRMGRALGRPARLLPVPATILETGARLVGKASISQRLCGSLQVDISKTRKLLGWAPPVTVDEALAKTARHFLESQGK